MGILIDGKSNQTITGQVIDGGRHGLEVYNSSNIVIKNCTFRNHEGQAVTFHKSRNVRLEGCTVDGSGLSAAEWAKHGVDCIHVKECQDIFIVGCPVIARGAHAGIVVLNTSGAVEILDNGFERMNGSLITLKRGVDRARIYRNKLRDAPTLAQAPAAHKVPHAAMQLSGVGHEVAWNDMAKCGKGILGSSGGKAAGQPQVLVGCRFHDNVYRDCEVTLLELQAVDGPGSLDDNEFLREQFWNARQLVHFAMPGMPSDLARNRWIDCGGGQGGFFVSGRSISRMEDMNGGSSRGNRTISTPPVLGTTPTPTPPPTTPIPPPTTPPTQPPATGAPVLVSVTPARGKPGDTVTIAGRDLGATARVIVGGLTQVQAAWRGDGTGGTVTLIANTPPGATVAYVRRLSDGAKSNEVPFTVTTSAPPTPPPPTTPPTQPPGRRRVKFSPGQVQGTVGEGSPFPASATQDGKAQRDGDRASCWLVPLRDAAGQPVSQRAEFRPSGEEPFSGVRLALWRAVAGRRCRFMVELETPQGWQAPVGALATLAGQEWTEVLWPATPATAARLTVLGDSQGPTVVRVYEVEWMAG